MALELQIRRCRWWYSQLLRLFPKAHFDRFAEPMAQTFTDLLRERAHAPAGLLRCAAAVAFETSLGIIDQHFTAMIARPRALALILTATASLLLVPLVAMQFTHEVNWSPIDFVVAGALLFGTGLAFEVATRKAHKLVHRLAVGLALSAGLLLIWVNLAVGIIGAEDNPANLMYVAVLLVALVGAAFARLKAQPMSRAMFATAATQALVLLVALTAGFTPRNAAGQAVLLDGLFIAMWIGAGLLFQRANETREVAAL